MSNLVGRVHSLESFGSVDGPGVRFVIFLQGCKMRCRYCHNPETWSTASGEEWNAHDLLERALRYKSYWSKNGGITVSGGEPLLQPEFVTELFELAKQKNIHTAIDTSGQPFDGTKRVSAPLEAADLVILDIKMFDGEAHKRLTGFGNENILAMARYLSDIGKDMWIRRVLVPGLTDSEEDLKRTSEFVSRLKTVKRVEVLPYHAFGMAKWDSLDIPYSLRDAKAPSAGEILRAQKLLGII